MAIKYLKGVRGIGTQTLTTTRPTGFKFPIGIKNTGVIGGPSINSAVCATTSTIDMLIVGGGGRGGYRPQQTNGGGGGGGGAGGFRLITANTFTDSPAFSNTAFIVGDLQTFPIVVGSDNSESRAFGLYVSPTGGQGGTGGYSPGSPGASGGGGGSQLIINPSPIRYGGSGVAGLGCNGGNGGKGTTQGGAGGGAGGNAPGLTPGSGTGTSFTGAPVTFSAGGPPIRSDGPANSGNGGGGGNNFSQPGGAGGSGIVAVRYVNNQAPTTPLFSGGDCVCCTGGCIIHIFCSSGFINIGAAFSIN